MYPSIIELYACFLKIFVMIFLIPMNFSISFGIFSTPKLSMLSNEFLLTHTCQDLLGISHPLF